MLLVILNTTIPIDSHDNIYMIEINVNVLFFSFFCNVFEKLTETAAIKLNEARIIENCSAPIPMSVNNSDLNVSKIVINP